MFWFPISRCHILLINYFSLVFNKCLFTSSYDNFCETRGARLRPSVYTRRRVDARAAGALQTNLASYFLFLFLGLKDSKVCRLTFRFKKKYKARKKYNPGITYY